MKELMLEGIDINKSNQSKESKICHYWYVKEIGYRFQQCVCNKYNDIFMMIYELENIAIPTVKCVDYRYVLSNRLKIMQLAGKIIPS